MKLQNVVNGAAGGVVATAAMSAFTAVADLAGAMNRHPPKIIVRWGLPLGGTPLPERDVDGLAVAAHVGYGASAGSVFGVLRPRSRRRALVAEGMGYGLVLWAAGYEGWLPALDILPPAHRDRRGRALTMFAGHIVYGATLGWVYGAVQRRAIEPNPFSAGSHG